MWIMKWDYISSWNVKHYTTSSVTHIRRMALILIGTCYSQFFWNEPPIDWGEQPIRSENFTDLTLLHINILYTQTTRGPPNPLLPCYSLRYERYDYVCQWPYIITYLRQTCIFTVIIYIDHYSSKGHMTL